MKTRSQLSAAEVAEVREGLSRKLATVGVQSQPEVAVKILELTRDPDAQLRDYAGVIRSDAALSGRLLKLSNSALFGQRTPVTNVDRACLLLGVERLKSIALGFHLSRAAAGDKSAGLSREVWGQSLLRACLSSELARQIVPSYVAEAFVVGLLADAGIPLMARLVGKEYAELWGEKPTPGRLHRLESERLLFNHTDVMAALAKLWKLPELLAAPIDRHHTAPPMPLRPEPVHRLHAIVYTVGLLDLKLEAGKAVADVRTPGMTTLQRTLNVEPDALSSLIEKAVGEYSATTELFGEIADAVRIDDLLIEKLQVGIVQALDGLVEQTLEREIGQGTAVKRFELGGHLVELHRANDGNMVAYLYDSRGQRLVSHFFQPGKESAGSLRDALGLASDAPDETAELERYLKSQAA